MGASLKLTQIMPDMHLESPAIVCKLKHTYTSIKT